MAEKRNYEIIETVTEAYHYSIDAESEEQARQIWDEGSRDDAEYEDEVNVQVEINEIPAVP